MSHSTRFPSCHGSPHKQNAPRPHNPRRSMTEPVGPHLPKAPSDELIPPSKNRSIVPDVRRQPAVSPTVGNGSRRLKGAQSQKKIAIQKPRVSIPTASHLWQMRNRARSSTHLISSMSSHPLTQRHTWHRRVVEHSHYLSIYLPNSGAA